MSDEQKLSQDDLWEQARKDREAGEESGKAADDKPAAGQDQGAADGQAGGEGAGGGGDQAEQGQAGDDPLAGLPEPARELINSMQARQVEQEALIRAQNQQLARANGTIGNMKQRIDQFEPVARAAAEQKRKEAEAKSVERSNKAKATREKLADLDLEELAEFLPIDGGQPPADADTGAGNPAADAAGATDGQQAAAQQTEDSTHLRRLLAVEDLHPGWRKEVKLPAFKSWQQQQQPDIQALANSDSIEDADKLLTLWEEHKKKAADIARIEAERQARLRRGETVQGRSSGPSAIDTSADGLWEQAKRDRAKVRQATA